MRSKLGSAILITMILLGFAIALVPPTRVVKAATGTPRLAAIRCNLQALVCDDIIIAEENVSIKVGDMYVAEVDGVPVEGYLFAVVLKPGGRLGDVTFSGGQFALYISKNGLASITEDDLMFTPLFNTKDVARFGLRRVGDYYLGTVEINDVNYSVVIGPIRHQDITAEYRFIKVWDGAPLVATTETEVEILPTLEISPSEGPGGALVTVRGYALRPNVDVRIRYSSAVLQNGTEVNLGIVIGVARVNEKGRFEYQFNVLDLMAENYVEVWDGENEDIPYADIVIEAIYADTGAPIGTVSYREYVRAFVELRSVERGDVAQEFVDLYTGSGSGVLTVEAGVEDRVVLAGAWWNPTDVVRIYFEADDELLGEATPNASGFFSVTLIVPERPGDNVVVVENAGVSYTFILRVVTIPILRLEPSEGPVGTEVTAIIAGFPPNADVTLVWIRGCVEEEIVVAEGRTNINGRLTLTFEVPIDIGGERTVEARVGNDTLASATFTIIPDLVVDPLILGHTGEVAFIRGTGLDPAAVYYILIDNQLAFPEIQVTVNSCGLIEIAIVEAGFRPGLHVASLYTYNGMYELIDKALFSVTCVGDEICSGVLANLILLVDIGNRTATIATDLGTIKAKLDELKSIIEAGNAMLVDIRGRIATIATDLGTIKAKLDKLEPIITSIDGNVVKISTSIGDLRSDLVTIRKLIEAGNATLVDIRGRIATIATDLGTIRANLSAIAPIIVAIRGDVAYIRTEIGTIRANSDLLPVLLPEINKGVTLANMAAEDLKKTSTAINKSLSDLGKTIDSKVDEISGKIGGVQTDVAAIKSDVSDVKANLGAVPGLTTAVWIAVAFSVVSAATAIFVAITIMRKIAG